MRDSSLDPAALLQLLRLPRVGPVSLRKILVGLARTGIPPERIQELSDESLHHDLHLTKEQVQALRNLESDAEEDLRQCAEMGIETLLPGDSRFPRHPLTILGTSASLMLFAWGNTELLQRPALGLSGSRQASDMSLAAISKLCEIAGSDRWVIVSGGARGSDEAAHLCAIREGSGTIIVLPTGIFKPNFRKDLVQHLEESRVLLLSEFPPEQSWTPGNAMQRNRLIAALSRGIVLVEPGARGGTSGTGRITLKLGIPLYVLDNGSEWSAPEIRFIKAGAHPLNPDRISSKELTLLLQRSWESSELKRSAAPDLSLH